MSELARGGHIESALRDYLGGFSAQYGGDFSMSLSFPPSQVGFVHISPHTPIVERSALEHAGREWLDTNKLRARLGIEEFHPLEVRRGVIYLPRVIGGGYMIVATPNREVEVALSEVARIPLRERKGMLNNSPYPTATSITEAQWRRVMAGKAHASR